MIYNALNGYSGLGDPTSDLIDTVKKWASLTNPFTKMSYKEFTDARTASMKELVYAGAKHNDADGCAYTPLGWGEELCKGFTNAQIEKNLSPFKDYAPDYKRFLEVVYFPVLRKVNPAEFERQVIAVQNTTLKIPGTTKGAYDSLSIAAQSKAEQDKQVYASFLQNKEFIKMAALSAGALAVLGIITWVVGDEKKKKIS